MTKVFHKDFHENIDQLDSFIANFDKIGEQLGKGDRNTIKIYDLNGTRINIKSFKTPNIINQAVYRFFRKSKARRSFEFANKITDLGIGTPHPIAYYEFPSSFLFKRSFYISEQLNNDLTFRELTRDLSYPDHELILRAFTRFTYELHEKNINFLDHSPGNTLIKKKNSGYDFFLVDLNRMEFSTMSFEKRIKNFERLTIHRSMVKTMSEEYSKCSGEDFEKIFDLMWRSTQEFQNKFHRKKQLKKKMTFWK